MREEALAEWGVDLFPVQEAKSSLMFQQRDLKGKKEPSVRKGKIQKGSKKKGCVASFKNDHKSGEERV